METHGGPAARGSETLTVAIIGSGAAASAAAMRASAGGARVTLIEDAEVGGTCVNTGCVPSKIMLRGAHIAHLHSHHPFSGLERRPSEINRTRLRQQQQACVTELRESKYIRVISDDPGITLVRGRARFHDPHTLLVEDERGERPLHPDRILIATGSCPRIPDIPGLEDTPYWTSADALASERIPEQLIIIGGGLVALELGQAFRRLGARVTLLARTTLLSREDAAIGEALTEYLLREQVDVGLNAGVRSVRWDRGRFTVRTDTGTVYGDRLLVAAGRRPNTDILALDRAGIVTDDRGAIRVDAKMQTSAKHVYAAGDCTTQPPFVYVAAAAGSRAAANMTGGDESLDLGIVPWVLFTDPQVAAVGLDEHQAGRAGLATISRTLTLDNIPRAVVNFDRRGFIKLIAERVSGRLLGARIVAPAAGEIIQTAAVCISNGTTTGQLAEQMFPYLTMAEGLKLCAQSFTTDVARLPCCAG